MQIDINDLFNEIERRGLKIRDFAKQVGIDEGKVYSWKARRGNPKRDDYVKVQKFLMNEKEDPELPDDHYLIKVMLHRLAALLAKQSGNSEVVELEQIKKDAERLKNM